MILKCALSFPGISATCRSLTNSEMSSSSETVALVFETSSEGACEAPIWEAFWVSWAARDVHDEAAAEGGKAEEKGFSARPGTASLTGTGAAVGAATEDAVVHDIAAAEEGNGADAEEDICVDAGVKGVAVRFQAHEGACEAEGASVGVDADAVGADGAVAAGGAAEGGCLPLEALSTSPRRIEGTALP